MPKLGEIRKSRVGVSEDKHWCNDIWAACPTCGKERWVRNDTWANQHWGKSTGRKCQVCSRKSRTGSKNPMWKGGRQWTRGYIYILLRPNDFFYSMATAEGVVMEHRLVMAKSLGRALHSWELVHHKDGDKSNNQLGNLELTTPNGHITDHCKGYRDGFVKGLRDGRLQKIKDLEAEVARLKLQNAIQKV